MVEFITENNNHNKINNQVSEFCCGVKIKYVKIVIYMEVNRLLTVDFYTHIVLFLIWREENN